MFDRYLAGPLKALLAPPARRLAALGVSADQVTLVGFVVGMLAVPLIALGAFEAGIAAILVNRLLDGLDGAIARIRGPTDRGAFLDIALDFFFYAAVPFGFALNDPGTNALAAAALIFAFVGTGSSFLAYAVIAAKRGIASEEYPEKGLYFLGGLTEGTETIVFLIAICLFPHAFAPLALIFAALCLVTTFSRWFWGWKSFG